jgi:hypothetical protein
LTWPSGWEALQVGEFVEFGHAARALCGLGLQLIAQLAKVAGEQLEKRRQVGTIGRQRREHHWLQKTLPVQQKRENGNREVRAPLGLHAHCVYEQVVRAVVPRQSSDQCWPAQEAPAGPPLEVELDAWCGASFVTGRRRPRRFLGRAG